MPVPVVMQSERSECGIACLAMVAGYHGYRSTLRELRSKFRLSLRGMTLRRLRDCAESLGLACRGVRLELAELNRLRTPAVLHWELDHFVVLQAANRRRIVIVDPALGRRRFTYEEAGSRFTGVALEVWPTPALQPKRAVETVKLAAFLAPLRGLGTTLAGVFAMTLLLQGFALIMPPNTQFTVDHGIRQGDMHIVVALAIGFGLLTAISTATGYLRSLLLLYVGNTSALRMVGGLAHHLLRLPDAWFTARHTGDVLSRFGSISPIRQFLTTGVFAMLIDGLMAVGAFAVTLAYSPTLALVLCAFLTLFAALNAATYAPLRNLNQESIAASATESTSFIENIQRHRAIKLLSAETDREDAWGEKYIGSINASARLARFGLHLGLAGSTLVNVENLVMLLLGAHKVIEGEFTLGMLFAFSSYASIFSGRVHALVQAGVNLRMLKLHLERIGDIGLEDRELPAEPEGIRVELRGEIDVRSLAFSYGDEEGQLLDGIDFRVGAGEFVAVTGESGKGKTTLVKLLTRLLDPEAGEILVDGVNLRGLDTAHYRRQLGVVMQDDDLFSGSLLENIAAGETHPDLDRARWAAQIACIDEDIERMPMQYLTLVGHMGSSLSGGQRQRLMVARAVYREPRLIILDEGTAHLNDQLQLRLLDNLSSLGATIIAVTHDPRVTARADRCIAL
ncbi:MAG: peptidase domain-containing ABC transporter [Gammaproteobacteria bacterium]|nr:peptidase domain-containing ABC transporter [Gammaproteobacteria bacterium]MDE0441272.1 peptidase domain-containing ABC transporter [Gammaproteobacteria bacterium]